MADRLALAHAHTVRTAVLCLTRLASPFRSQVRDQVAVHVPCSSKKMGIEESFAKLAGLCADEVWRTGGHEGGGVSEVARVTCIKKGSTKLDGPWLRPFFLS